MFYSSARILYALARRADPYEAGLRRRRAPRWVLLYGATQLLLLDRTKWPSKRFLRFDLEEIRISRDADRRAGRHLGAWSFCPASRSSLVSDSVGSCDCDSHRIGS